MTINSPNDKNVHFLKAFKRKETWAIQKLQTEGEKYIIPGLKKIFDIKKREIDCLFNRNLKILLTQIHDNSYPSESNIGQLLREQTEKSINKRLKDEEREWKLAILANDRAAYKKIYQSCFRITASLVLSSTGQMEDAKDLFQEALLALFENTKKPCFYIDVKVCTYVSTIAKYKWYKKIRDEGRSQKYLNQYLEMNQGYEDDSTAYFFDESNLTEHQLNVMNACIAKLCERCQLLIKWRYFEGLSHAEITQRLIENGLNPNNSRAQLFTCMERLRNEFNNNMNHQ